ncbi:hypothetical protein BGZ68_005204 [Mortierella alpina]|nr:hypothetical protein BGZ68_005204 [Mortierella alpina]
MLGMRLQTTGKTLPHVKSSPKHLHSSLGSGPGVEVVLVCTWLVEMEGVCDVDGSKDVGEATTEIEDCGDSVLDDVTLVSDAEVSVVWSCEKVILIDAGVVNVEDVATKFENVDVKPEDVAFEVGDVNVKIKDVVFEIEDLDVKTRDVVFEAEGVDVKADNVVVVLRSAISQRSPPD